MKCLKRPYIQSISVLALTAILSGCGEPDFRSMKPSVWKPTAQVFIVGQVPHWDSSGVSAIAETGHVNVNVNQVKETDMPAVMMDTLKKAPAGMAIVVANGPVDPSWITSSESMTDTRFEFVGTSPAAGVTSNQVKQVIPEQDLTVYMLGWLAGQYDVSIGNTPIGWITDGTSTVSRSAIQRALGAAYAANTGVQFTPVSLSATTLPQLLVTTRPLSDADWLTVRSHGSIVISLCAGQSNLSVLGQPQVPPVQSVAGDLGAFAGSNWTPGLSSSKQPPLLWVNANLVNANMQTSLQTVWNSLQSGVSPLDAWNGVPQGLKLLWSPVVNSGQP